MVKLHNISLVCVDCRTPGQAIGALKISLKHIEPARAVLFTDISIAAKDIETVLIPKIKSKREYSEFIMKELWKHITTEYVLIIQGDGYVLDGNQWADEFLKYDYIGASWVYDSERRVGNGGFSLRSKKLLDILGKDDFIDVLHPEDQSICILYKFYLEEKYGIKFAPEELADKFAFEIKTPAEPTFGFHNWFHRPYQKTVIIKRKGAMGDVIDIEPVLAYFHKKNYRVVLDTLDQFHDLFIQHYFKVHRPEELDQRLIPNAEVYNLDMAYESNPQQLHLKTAFEFCGVPKEEMLIQRPRLRVDLPTKIQCKLFVKYAVIHMDDRPQPHRNVKGINWEIITKHLTDQGYTVLQIGIADGPDIPGALRMNTPGEPFMMWVISGADLFIGADSGPSHVAVAFNIPSIIFFGSVNPEFIHPDLNNVMAIHNHHKKICDKPFCWHSEVTTVGIECYVDKKDPPCIYFDTNRVIYAIDKLTGATSERTKYPFLYETDV